MSNSGYSHRRQTSKNHSDRPRYGGFDRGNRGGKHSSGGFHRGGKRGDYPQRNPEDLYQIEDLLDTLNRIDGSSYGAYRQTVGTYACDGYDLVIYRAQVDPYAPASHCAIRFDTDALRIPEGLLETRQRCLAVADFLARRFRRGLQGSRDLQMPPLGQQIIERSGTHIANGQGEIRFQIKFPARGRTIMGRQMIGIISSLLPSVVENALYAYSLSELRTHVETYEDYLALRQTVIEQDWVAFVADGSILARESGVSDLPLQSAIPTRSPQSLAATVQLPHSGTVSGMAIKRGITLIVGGGYHGKSTLLQALEHGVYAHIPADGRELVASLPEAVSVRAEDGRSIVGVDIRPFISDLPGGRTTDFFSTQNASGSTSQAAAIVEALEQQAPALFIDEDTSATNLMIRDRRMRALVAEDSEPITPLVDRIVALRERGTSTVLVMGGFGDYLDLADTVIMLDNYNLADATEKARAICVEIPAEKPSQNQDASQVFNLAPRCPQPEQSSDPRGRKVKSRRVDTITLGGEELDVSDLSQLVNSGQTEAASLIINHCLEEIFDGKTPISQALQQVFARIDEDGLDYLTQNRPRPSLVRPRPTEVWAALNRYRKLRIAGGVNPAEESNS